MHASRTLLVVTVVGLGTARLVETVKEVLPSIPPAGVKSTFATFVAASLGATLGSGDVRERVATAVGAAGAAMLAHDLTSLLSVTTDRQKILVMRAAGQR